MRDFQPLLLQVPLTKQHQVMAFVTGNDVQQRPHAHPLAVRQTASSQHGGIEMLGEVHRRGSHELQLLH